MADIAEMLNVFGPNISTVSYKRFLSKGHAADLCSAKANNGSVIAESQLLASMSETTI